MESKKRERIVLLICIVLTFLCHTSGIGVYAKERSYWEDVFDRLYQNQSGPGSGLFMQEAPDTGFFNRAQEAVNTRNGIEREPVEAELQGPKGGSEEEITIEKLDTELVKYYMYYSLPDGTKVAIDTERGDFDGNNIIDEADLERAKYLVLNPPEDSFPPWDNLQYDENYPEPLADRLWTVLDVLIIRTHILNTGGKVRETVTNRSLLTERTYSPRLEDRDMLSEISKSYFSIIPNQEPRIMGPGNKRNGSDTNPDSEPADYFENMPNLSDEENGQKTAQEAVSESQIDRELLQQRELSDDMLRSLYMNDNKTKLEEDAYEIVQLTAKDIDKDSETAKNLEDVLNLILMSEKMKDALEGIGFAIEAFEEAVNQLVKTYSELYSWQLDETEEIYTLLNDKLEQILGKKLVDTLLPEKYLYVKDLTAREKMRILVNNELKRIENKNKVLSAEEQEILDIVASTLQPKRDAYKQKLEKLFNDYMKQLSPVNNLLEAKDTPTKR